MNHQDDYKGEMTSNIDQVRAAWVRGGISAASLDPGTTRSKEYSVKDLDVFLFINSYVHTYFISKIFNVG